MESGEDRLIAKYFRPLAHHAGAVGLRDDAAFLTPPEGCDLVLTKDAIVGGVHFLMDDPADAVARKALRVNLSDLAAKGARPTGFLLALALPEIREPWLHAFSQGLAADAEAFGCALFGGDTVRSPGPLMISVTAFGTLPRGQMVHRHGAKPGDRLFVSGTIGDAALGLLARKGDARVAAWKLRDEEQSHLLSRYLLPEPRTGLADVVRTYASAAMDVSDGLAGDLGKLCHESHVSAHVEAARIPFSAGVRKAVEFDGAMRVSAISGGDDYEILCAVADAKADAFLRAAAATGIAVTEIGRIAAGIAPPQFVTAEGRLIEIRMGSYSHF